jgi:hypothetical protein
MQGEWILQTNLNGVYAITKWNTQEGAIADRERQLRPRYIRDSESPTGIRMVWPDGWTAIRRARERNG